MRRASRQKKKGNTLHLRVTDDECDHVYSSGGRRGRGVSEGGRREGGRGMMQNATEGVRGAT
jgi:hypothetical protein